MMQISIPTPCSEDWNSMLPDQQGRHCLSCAKTVVDFTVMNDDEVRGYLLNNASGKTCGRFKHTQLQQIQLYLPENIFNTPLPLWKVFLLASAVAFSSMLFSCNAPAPQNTGKALIEQKTTPGRELLGEPAITDTVPTQPVKTTVDPGEIMGLIAIPVKDTVKPAERYIKGDISIQPRDSINCRKPLNPK